MFNNTTEEEREQPPEGADRFEVGERKIVATSYEEEWGEDEHFEPPADIEEGDSIVFEEGDTLPATLAKDVWHHFKHRIIALDENGEVLRAGYAAREDKIPGYRL